MLCHITLSNFLGHDKYQKRQMAHFKFNYRFRNLHGNISWHKFLVQSPDFGRHLKDVKLKKELLKYFECVFQFWWVTQVHSVDKAHEQKASLCHTFTVIHNLFSLDDDWHMGRGVAFLCSIDDKNLQSVMSMVVSDIFFADILSKTCESVLRSQYTIDILSSWICKRRFTGLAN